MSKKEITEVEIEEFINEILTSSKYKAVHLPAETLRDLINQELPRHKQIKDVIKSIKKKLHNIVAPYLGDPDYHQALVDLETAFLQGQTEVKETCLSLLSSHASTKERIPIMGSFYQELFSFTGTPDTILDLACGLHPFSLPWMNLARSTQYYAFDLHQPRIELINSYFKLDNRPQLAVYRDILVQPPDLTADVAFFFKEAHRFEQRQHGCNRQFWEAIKAKYLLVSLPTSSLTGKHDKIDQHKRLVYETIEGLNWPVTELLFETELVFCIQKNDES